MRLFSVLFMLAVATPVSACPQAFYYQQKQAVVYQQKAIIVPVLVPTYSISYQPPATVVYPAPQVIQPAPQVIQPAPQVQQQTLPQKEDCCEEVLKELRLLRAALLEARGGNLMPPAPVASTPEMVMAAKCAGCHGASVSEKKGFGFTLMSDSGKVAELSLGDRRRMVLHISRGTMPKAPEAPLSEAEKKMLLDWLSQ